MCASNPLPFFIRVKFKGTTPPKSQIIVFKKCWLKGFESTFLTLLLWTANKPPSVCCSVSILQSSAHLVTRVPYCCSKQCAMCLYLPPCFRLTSSCVVAGKGQKTKPPFLKFGAAEYCLNIVFLSENKKCPKIQNLGTITPILANFRAVY